MTMKSNEFWIASLSDEDHDLHWSDIIWGDGMTAAEVLEQAMQFSGQALHARQMYEVHGPYICNAAATYHKKS